VLDRAPHGLAQHRQVVVAVVLGHEAQRTTGLVTLSVTK
jgi:hypothetical protein